jgi:exodeoxyribonuclease-3
MKLLSWNVNGIRSILGKGFREAIAAEKPDVVCLQEVKARQEQVLEACLPDDYRIFWNAAEKPGYSGTAVYTRVKPIKAQMGLGISELDNEGRVITLEFPQFHLVNVYTPNAREDLSRLKFRHQRWDPEFLRHVKQLERTKPVVFCGDLNVAHEEIDLARPKPNVGKPGFTHEEREGFRNIVKAGFLDTFREFQKEGGHYSWWSYRGGARERNVGWRIDYFCLSQAFRPELKRAWILPGVKGSDHCPVGIELK